VAARTPSDVQKELSTTLQVPVIAGTVNRGSEVIVSFPSLLVFRYQLGISYIKIGIGDLRQ